MSERLADPHHMLTTHEWMIFQVRNPEQLRKTLGDVAEGKLQGLMLALQTRLEALAVDVSVNNRTGERYTEGFNAGITVCHENEAKVLTNMIEVLESAQKDLRVSRREGP